MASFTKVIPIIFHWEGGYDANPNDTGNWYQGKLIGTNHGISAPLLAEYVGDKMTSDDMKNLTKEKAQSIMKKRFWDKIKGDDINSQSIANFICDWVYNSGPGVIDNIQRVIGCKDDGKIGPNTIAAINSHDNEPLFNALVTARTQFIQAIVANSVTNYLRKHPAAGERELKKKTKLMYKNGWLNRINSFKFE